MRLCIKNPETERLVRELAAETGQTLTAAVTQALRAKLESIRAERGESDEPRLERDAVDRQPK